jgi:TPR repeat protein
MTEPMDGPSMPVQPSPAEFTAGTSALPGTSEKEAMVASLESGAVRGDAKSQFLLSLRYSEGRGVVKDDSRAASLATKAAEQGLAIAQYRLGALYERGVGVEKSMPQAKNWYEKSAKLGNRKAMHNLAVLLAYRHLGNERVAQFLSDPDSGLALEAARAITDTPIPAAGVWATDRVAVSCTGQGEYFIRTAAAAQLGWRVEAGASVVEAGEAVIAGIGDLGGDGGLIALDAQGNRADPFNSQGMKRAWLTPEGEVGVDVFGRS